MADLTPSPVAEAIASGLHVLETHPLTAETPLERLDGVITPIPLFYYRENFPRPEASRLDPASYRLTIDGLVTRPRQVTLADLAALPQVTRPATLECAGNNRSFLRPFAPGNQFEDGAVSTAIWGGVRLRDALDLVEIQPGAIEVLTEGLDEGAGEQGLPVLPFQRSLRLDHARSDEVLLATRMNDEPLPIGHGGPLRVIVPGRYGVASVKWLHRLSLLDHPFDGHFQTDRYVLRQQAGEVGEQLGPMRVKSVIAWPRPGRDEELSPGPATMRGFAWSGTGPIVRVEVSADGGRSWSAATLDEPISPFAWQPWRADVTLPPGETTLIARATDAAGHVQPERGEWNQRGYANNEVARAVVRVAAR